VLQVPFCLIAGRLSLCERLFLLNALVGERFFSSARCSMHLFVFFWFFAALLVLDAALFAAIFLKF